MDEVWSLHAVCGFGNCPPTFVVGFGGQILEHVFLFRGARKGGGLGLMFAGYAPLASQGPYLVIVYSVANNRQICNFRDSNLVTFYFYELTHFFRLNEEHFAFHDLQYKHSGTFANR